ncbi:MAG: catalase, partial [Gammaproteobacteria bacterium]
QRAVKYSTRPCNRSLANIRDKQGGEYLQNQLKRHLASDSGCFEFLVQFQTDPEAMPIEDASVEWDKLFAPFEPIALLTIATQNFDSHEQMKICENLSFNPWRALPEHRPLGGINRARGAVLTELAKFKTRQRDAASSALTM